MRKFWYSLFATLLITAAFAQNKGLENRVAKSNQRCRLARAQIPRSSPSGNHGTG